MAVSQTNIVVANSRVLVVDGDRRVADSVWSALLDCRVTAEPRAADAVARIERGERFDVVFCALHMNGMSGAELFLRVARVDPDQAERIIFVAAGGGLSDEFLAEHNAIETPLERAEVRAMAARVLDMGSPLARSA